MDALPTNAFSPTRVLVAEDDDDIRAVMTTGLRCDGHEITEVANGIALFTAVARAMEERRAPDVIVSDIRMPLLSGLRAIAGLREARCHTPVVLVTAHGDERERQVARRLGVSSFLVKPFDLFELRRLVGDLVSHRWRAAG